jgi:hypothetical protein
MGHKPAIQQINAALQGSVIDVLADLLPEVKVLPRARALEHILDDVVLLDRCFEAFHTHPERFITVLRDGRRNPIRSPEDILECGRSLEDVVAMVVRTAAKRHFRKRLDGVTRPLRGGARSGGRLALVGRLLALLRSPPPAPRRANRGRVLYEAFGEYLRHEWQVPLVPEYASLSPQLVRRLGARILDYRLPDEVRRLGGDPTFVPAPRRPQLPVVVPVAVPAGDPRKPAAISGNAIPPPAEIQPQRQAADDRARLQDILTADGSRLKPTAFAMALFDPAVRAAMPDPGAVVRVTDMLSGVGPAAARTFTDEMGLRLDQIAALLVCAQSMLGPAHFVGMFGIPGNPKLLSSMAARAKAAGIDRRSPVHVIAAFVKAGFSAKPPA